MKLFSFLLQYFFVALICVLAFETLLHHYERKRRQAMDRADQYNIITDTITALSLKAGAIIGLIITLIIWSY